MPDTGRGPDADAELQHHEPPRKLQPKVLSVWSGRCELRSGDSAGAEGLTLCCRTDLYHALTWPQLSYVAEAEGKIVGYILAKMYVVSLSANRSTG